MKRKTTYKVLLITLLSILINLFGIPVQAEDGPTIQLNVFLQNYSGSTSSEAGGGKPAYYSYSSIFYGVVGKEGKGFTPNTEYTVIYDLYQYANDPGDDGYQFYIRRERTVKADENGELEYSPLLGYTRFERGEYYYTVTFKSNDENNPEEYIFDGKDNTNLHFYIVNNSSAYVLVNDQYYGGPFQPATVIRQKGKEEAVNIKSDLRFTTRYANIDCVVTSAIYKVNEEAEGGAEKISDDIVETVTLDDTGLFDSFLDLGTFPSETFETGEMYYIAHDIKRADGTNVSTGLRRQYNQYFTFEDYEEKVERKSYVNWSFSKLDEDTEEVLSGVKMKLVKGSSADGEVVKEWVTSKEDTIFELEVGTYTLVEIEPLKGYMKKDPVTFELTEDDAYISGANHSGYHIYSDGITTNLIYIYRSGNKATTRVGYCFNMTKDYPSEDNRYELDNELIYQEYLSSEELLEEHITSQTYASEELQAQLQNIIYKGYPSNAKTFEVDGNMVSLQEKYGLSDEMATIVTQHAVWHFTEGRDFTQGNFHKQSEQAFAAYNELIASENVEIPETFKMYLYITDNKNYQNVLAYREVSENIAMILGNKKATEINVKKNWDDCDDELKRRPKSVTVYLLANGTRIQETQLDASSNWEYTFTQLPLYENGEKITYSIEEESVDYYLTKIDPTHFTLHNVTRPWFPKTPDKEEEYGNVVLKKTVSNGAPENKEYSFSVKMEMPDGNQYEEIVHLKGNEEMSYDYVPDGTIVHIGELDAEEYIVTITIDGTTTKDVQFIAEKDIIKTIVFNNALREKKTVETSDESNIKEWAMLMASSTLVFIGSLMVILKNKRIENMR